jgi:hypothetical protein
MEDNRLSEKLDTLNAAMVTILVKQAEMTSSVNSLTEKIDTNANDSAARNLTIADHSIRLTKIESSMKILAWISVIISGVVTWWIIQLLSGS